jgi:transcriptional regulator with XRE-family HTH domain
MPTKYEAQRTKRTPPHVSLADLRAAVGLTLDEVATRMAQEFPEMPTPSRGALSAIENGHRGASVQMLSALCAAYGLRNGAITTNYEPRTRESEAVA